MILPLAHRRLELGGLDGPKGFAVVDEADWPAISAHLWYLSESQNSAPAVRGKVEGKQVYLHRFVFGLEPGDKRQVDHVNGDTLDCRKSNLRLVTGGQNAQNQGPRARRAERQSMHRGVHWAKTKQRWVASVMIEGRTYRLGHYTDEEEAARVVAKFRAEHMPYSKDAREAA